MFFLSQRYSWTGWLKEECNTSITISHSSTAGTPSMRKPASDAITSDSVELCETEACFLHVQLLGTNVRLPKYTKNPRSTNFINFFHIRLGFCFLPAMCWSHTCTDKNRPFVRCTKRHSQFDTFSHPISLESNNSVFNVGPNFRPPLCRGRRVLISGHSDLGSFNDSAASIVTWAQAETASAACPAHPGSLALISSTFHLWGRRTLLCEYCIRDSVVNLHVTSEYNQEVLFLKLWFQLHILKMTDLQPRSKMNCSWIFLCLLLVLHFVQLPRWQLFELLPFFVHCSFRLQNFHCCVHRNKLVHKIVSLSAMWPSWSLDSVDSKRSLVDSWASTMHYMLCLLEFLRASGFVVGLPRLFRAILRFPCHKALPLPSVSPTFSLHFENGFLELSIFRLDKTDASQFPSLVELWFFDTLHWRFSFFWTAFVMPDQISAHRESCLAVAWIFVSGSSRTTCIFWEVFRSTVRISWILSMNLTNFDPHRHSNDRWDSFLAAQPDSCLSAWHCQCTQMVLGMTVRSAQKSLTLGSTWWR